MAKDGGAKDSGKDGKSKEGKISTQDGKPKEGKTSSQDGKSKEGKAAKNGTKGQSAPQQLLSKLRPRRNLIFFPVFLFACVWVAVFSDPCNVKKRVDCGWAGISGTMCMTGACTMLDGFVEQTVEVDRPSGKKLGLKMKWSAKLGVSQIQGISEGSAQEYNKKLPDGSAQKIEVGDGVASVNGATGKTAIDKMLGNATQTTFSIGLMRAKAKSASAVKLPSWIPRHKVIEKVLMSKGLDRAMRFFYRIGGVGFFCWYLSGYPPASLPLLYITPSTLTTWWLTGCCYNEQTERNGDPHCFQNRGDDLETVLAKVWKDSTWEKTKKLFKY